MIGQTIDLAKHHPMFRWGLSRGFQIGFSCGVISTAVTFFILHLLG